MATVQEINKFIKKIMDKYSMFLGNYFDDCGIDEEDDYVVFKNNKTDEKTIAKVGRYLGMTAREIRDLNNDAANKWFNKFPFFKFLLQFRKYNYYSQFDGIRPEERLLAAIFGMKIKPEFKYKKEDIKKRLTDTLTGIEEIIPGTIHEGAEIVDFNFHVEDFINFPYCEELVRGFIELTERHKELFYKSWDNDLSEEEIKEYDFLTSYLLASDTAHVGGLMYYKKVKQLVPIMKEENYKDYRSYVRIPGCKDFKPWKCVGFASNVYLAQRYEDIFPNTKIELREFCMQIKNIRCCFKWSDRTEGISDDELADIVIQELANPQMEDELERYLADNNPVKMVYIKKTKEELGDDADYAEKLSKLAAPPSKGGLTVPISEITREASYTRMMKRIDSGIKKSEEE